MNPPPKQEVRDTHTPPRQVRIGENWYDFEYAAKAMGHDRAEVVRQMIAWYLGETDEPPARPPVDAWAKQAKEARAYRAKKKAATDAALARARKKAVAPSKKQTD